MSEFRSVRDERPYPSWSIVHTSNPRRASSFIGESSPLPGPVRPKVGRDDTDEPCTRKTTGLGGSDFSGAPLRLRNMYSFTSPLCAQYSAVQSAPGCAFAAAPRGADRSEERRVGKECRSRWSTDQ